jgi:RNA polymerase sigma-70 factor, ECF subfamily
MLTNQSNDREVILAIQQGDTNALGIIYSRYGAIVYRLALRMLQLPNEAEDLTQEVFVALWKGIEKYDANRGTLSTYLMTITRSRSLNRIQQRKSQQNLQQKYARVTTEEQISTAMEFATNTELTSRVNTALSNISADRRKILELAYYGGKSQSEIASLLAIPLGTVKTRSRQGLLELRQLLSDLVES